MFLIQDQLLRGVEQRLERIEIGVLVGNQILIVIFSRCFAAFIVVDSPYQHSHPLIQHLVVFNTIQLLSNIYEDFLFVSINGDLKIVASRGC